MFIKCRLKPTVQFCFLSISHGCFQTQVEVALAAADGDLNVAVEILMSQQVPVDFFLIICNSTHLLNYLLPGFFLLKMFCLLVYCIYRDET
jgi:hypothetical protein